MRPKKILPILRFYSGQKLLEFATLDYLRKYLVDEPMLARQGEKGWDPSVEAEVSAAAIHRPRLTPRQEKMIKTQEYKKWKPAKGYRTVRAGKDVVADVEGNVPGSSTQSIKQKLKTQQEDLGKGPPEEIPDPLEDWLRTPPQTGKVKQKEDPFWDPKLGGAPTEVKVTPNITLRKRPKIPIHEADKLALRKKVSAGAEAFRDPIAGHLAQVEHGLTPDLRREYKPPIPGVPSFRLPLYQAGTEAHHQQGIRDVLAAKGWAYRKNVLKPLREYVRKQKGLEPVAPLTRPEVKAIHESVPPFGKRAIGTKRKPRKVTPTPDINVEGVRFQPGTVRALQGQFEKDVGKRVDIHAKRAQKIRTDIERRVGVSTLPLEHNRALEQEAMDRVKAHFNPGVTEPITPLDARQIAAFTGHKTEQVQDLHKSFLRHTRLGESQLGEEELRGKLFPAALRKVKISPAAAAGKPVAEAVTKFPLFKSSGIGLAGLGAVGAGAYLVNKLRKRKRAVQQEALQQMAARLREIRFQQREDPFSAPTPWHQKEARRWLLFPESRSRALYKGVSRAGRLASDIRAPKTAEGMVIGERGRERQPEWQKPWFKRTVITGGIVGTALLGRKIYKNVKKESQLAAGLMSKHLPLSETETAAANLTTGNYAKAIGKMFPRTSGVFSSASERLGGLRDRFRQEKKALIQGAARSINKTTHANVGEISGADVTTTSKGVKINWNNPAHAAKAMEEADRLEERGEQIAAHGRARRKQAKNLGATRQSMEDLIKEHQASSLLKLIQFQDIVPVISHYRGRRSERPKRKDPRLREGLLLGAGATTALTGTGLGIKYGWDRYGTKIGREQQALKEAQDYQTELAKRVAERTGTSVKGTAKRAAGGVSKVVSEADKLKTVMRRAAKVAGKIVEHQSRTPEIRLSALDKIRSKLSGEHDDNAVHDIAIGALEGGAAYPVSDYLVKRFAGKGAGIGRKIAVGGAVGGVATGLIGVGLSRALQRRRERRMKSLLMPIQFAQPNQRTLVAKDRYIKGVHERDIERADRLYAKAGLLGAGIGVLRKPSTFRRSALKGALAGIGVQKAARLYGESTKDQFGERSVFGKRVERAPEWLGTAAIGGYALKRLGMFSSKSRPIRFESKWVINPKDPETANAIRAVGIGAGGLGLGYAGLKLGRAAGVWGKVAPQVGKAAESVRRSTPSHFLKWLRSKLHLQSKLKEIRFKTVQWDDNPLYPDVEKTSVQVVPIKKIISHQETVKRHVVEDYKKKPGRSLPILHKQKGKYYVEDGNHRIVAKAEKGEKTIRARVLELRSMIRPILFEAERKHNIGAGALVAAAGLPLYKGAFKFGRVGLRGKIDRFMGRPQNYGKQVADYLEASQHVLNRGVTGKLAGVALRNPQSSVVKKLVGLGPAELGSGAEGLNKMNREHFSAFRSSHNEGLSAWIGEHKHQAEGKFVSVGKGKKKKQVPLTEIVEGRANKLYDDLSDLWANKGYNEREALRHVVKDPQAHRELFRNLATMKTPVVGNYAAITGGLATVPATAGLAVAATTRKNRDGSSAH
jgi:hypothetical protein